MTRISATLAAMCAVGSLAAQTATDPGKGLSVFVSSIQLDSGNTVAYTGPIPNGAPGYVSGDEFAKAGTVATATAQFGYLNRTPNIVENAWFTMIRSGYHTGIVLTGVYGEPGIEYRENPVELRVRYDGTYNAVCHLGFDEYIDSTKTSTKRFNKTSTATNIEGKLRPKLKLVEKDTSPGAPTGGLVAWFWYDALWPTAITYPVTAKQNEVRVDGVVRTIPRPQTFSAGTNKGLFSVKFVRGQKVRWHLDGWYDEASVEDITPGLGVMTVTPKIPSPRTTFSTSTIKSVATTPSPFTVGQVLPSWCFDSQIAMPFGDPHVYTVTAVSTLALPPGLLRAPQYRSELTLTAAEQAAIPLQERANAANWLINNRGSADGLDIQRALWLILGQPTGGDISSFTAASKSLAMTALTSAEARNFLPHPGSDTLAPQKLLILFRGGGGNDVDPAYQPNANELFPISLSPAAPQFPG